MIFLRMDWSRFSDALKELETLRSAAPKTVFENLGRLVDVPGELARVNPYAGAASGAGELTVRLQPTEFLLGVLAALRAGDFNLLGSEEGLQIIRHRNVLSSGGVATADDSRVGRGNAHPAASGSEAFVLGGDLYAGEDL